MATLCWFGTRNPQAAAGRVQLPVVWRSLPEEKAFLLG